MFIWTNYCLSFFLILLNWLSFSIFNCCCQCCLSSCLMCDCIWVRICAELLDNSATLNVMSLKLFNVIMSVFFKYFFCQNNIYLSDFRWFFLKLDFIQNVCVENCKYCEAAFFLSTDQNCWDILLQNVSNIIEMTQYYFLIKEINSNVVNQTWIITISQTCLARVLKYYKNDQILELCYQ